MILSFMFQLYIDRYKQNIYEAEKLDGKQLISLH